ncbi:MAG: hypothetical protein AB7R89_06260 [Dehalococcoidia bacterium]
MLLPDEFDGVGLNGGSDDYTAVFPIGSEYGSAHDLQFRARQGDVSYLGAESVAPRTITLQVRPGPGAPSSNQEWMEEAQGLFRPGPDLKSFKMSWRSITVEILVYVAGVYLHPDVPVVDDWGAPILDVTLVAPDPVWRDVTEQSDGTSPATVGGTVAARATLTLSPSGSTVRHVRVSLADVLGLGAYAYPFVASFDGSGAGASAATNYIAYADDREIPIWVDDPGSNPTRVLFTGDIVQDGTRFVDIFFGSSVNNTRTAQALLVGGIAIDDASISNATMVWNSFLISEHPLRKLTWRPARLGGHVETPSPGYVDIQSEASGAVTFTTVSGTAPAEYYDAMTCVIGSALAGTSNALSGVRRAYNGDAMTGDFDQVEIFVKIQALGATSLADAYLLALNTGNEDAANVDTAVDVDNALVLTIGMRLTVLGSNRRTLAIGPVPATDFALALASQPSVSVSSPATAHLIDGTFAIAGGDSITFDQMFVLDGDLVIDALDRTVTAPSDILVGRDIRFANDQRWLELQPGSVSWTAPANTTAELAWRNAYAG